ncbi:MAG TPA: efflux RND transporter periplasmic adaptor subunit [Acidiphilium sp.]|nr:efflux RND transporter periplasmic adaptor subunit [Acidiphilium sp.]HQU23551.1 efflux RND transporter periplasmic adaptor subunit [Acidiphilium sp.]
MSGSSSFDAKPNQKTPKRPRPVRRAVIVLLVLGVLLGAVFGWGAVKAMFIGKFLATLKYAPQTISTVTAEKSPFAPTIEATGNMVAEQGANLSSQVAGIVDTIMFKSGSDVKKGQVLLTLRPNNDSAVLAQLQAVAALAKITYQRDVAQLQAKAISAQTVDSDRATMASDLAQVQSQQALMAEKVIKAPFAGRIGVRAVDVGQYLAAGTAIASLQQLNPIDVNFYVPQTDLAKIRPGQAIAVTVGGFGNTVFTGKITSLDSVISTQSLMILVRGTLDNPHDELRPGSFARVSISTGAPQEFITLPKTAITYNAYGDTVYEVINQKKNGKTQQVAEQKFVTLGPSRGDQVAVVKGVAAGDVVVSAGQLKLHPGAFVKINNKIVLPNSPAPVVPLH